MAITQAKKIVTKVPRQVKLHPEVRKQIQLLPAKDGKLVLDRNNADHVAWMTDEEGEEDLY